MKTLIRYLSSEAIENCVMCLNYKFDNVIFFGRENIIYEENKNIGDFLINKCNVSYVKFSIINKKNVDSLIRYIEENIDFQDENYIDLTGSDGICEVALYKIAEEKDIPMYVYDIFDKKCSCVLDNKNKSKLNDIKHHLSLNIKEYIDMVGGCVNENMQKDNKSLNEEELNTILSVKRKYSSYWTFLCHLLSDFNRKEINGVLESTHKRPASINNEIVSAKNGMNYLYFLDFLKDLEAKKLINNLRINNFIVFNYANEYVMHNLIDGGAALEIEVFKLLKEGSSDCAIGVHLDWDGILPGKFATQEEKEKNVMNEIDVLRLDGYVLTFVSCKDTKAISNKAIYELESITRRFAGKYSNMVIVCRNKTLEATQRGKLVGIKIVTLNELKNRKNDVLKAQ